MSGTKMEAKRNLNPKLENYEHRDLNKMLQNECFTQNLYTLFIFIRTSNFRVEAECSYFLRFEPENDYKLSCSSVYHAKRKLHC